MTIKLFAHGDASSVDEALAVLSETCRPLAGGTDLLGLMKEELATPERLVNLKTIEGLDRIEAREDSWDVGATVRLSQLADFPAVSGREDLACLREALLQTASPQLRHMATNAGLFFNQIDLISAISKLYSSRYTSDTSTHNQCVGIDIHGYML